MVKHARTKAQPLPALTQQPGPGQNLHLKLKQLPDHPSQYCWHLLLGCSWLQPGLLGCRFASQKQGLRQQGPGPPQPQLGCCGADPLAALCARGACWASEPDC